MEFRHRSKYTSKEWQEIRDEVQKETFLADYSRYINPKHEEFEPKNKDEINYFNEAYKEYQHARCIDFCDQEIFEEIEKDMEKKGWIVAECSHCNELIIRKI